MQPESSKSSKTVPNTKSTSRSSSHSQHGIHRSSSSVSHGSSRGREPGSAAASTPRRISPRSDAGGDKEQGDAEALKAAAAEEDDNNIDDNNASLLKYEANDNSPKAEGILNRAPKGSSPIVNLPNGKSINYALRLYL
jgi:hypothetical protein